jgi:hypothetical protein
MVVMLPMRIRSTVTTSGISGDPAHLVMPVATQCIEPG